MAKNRITRKVRKSVSKGGRTVGTVPYHPSDVPIERRLSGKNPSVFDLRKWVTRFLDPRTNLVDRIGMIRSIPNMRINLDERLIVAREILMPLADGLSEFSRSGDRSFRWYGTDASWPLLRKEAWFMLHEWFFQTDGIYHLAESATFLDDLLAYFRPQEGEGWRKGELNFSQPDFTLEFCPSSDPLQDHMRRKRNEAIAKRTELAFGHAESFLAEYFKKAWNLRKENQYVEGKDTRHLNKVHKAVSVGRRRDLFGLASRLNPSWLENLPWDEDSFRDMVDHFTIQREVFCLTDRIPRACINGRGIEETQRIMVTIAMKNGWTNLPGVLAPRIDP